MKYTVFAFFIFISAIFLISCSKQSGDTARTDVPKYSIEQFYKNKQISGGSFSTNEDKLLVSSNESGIYNLYEITIGDGKQRQITNSTVESFFAIDYVPNTENILYTADKGGNEINHIYLLDKNGAVRDLTPDPKEKASFARWSLDKKAFYYLSNKRDPKFFDLYKMNINGWKPVMLYKNEAGYEVGDISWDEKALILSKKHYDERKTSFFSII
jgi:Dipeptidyl peptidase IV (DPP IV) N-terminal region.